MYTRHHVVYEIYNHEIGTITFFEHFENIEKWEEDNLKNPEGYKEYGVKLITSAETDIWYTEMGKPYPYYNPQPKNWLERLFMKDYELKLEESLKVNKEMSRQWPRN